MDFLFRQPEWAIFIALVAAFFAVFEAGWRRGLRGHRAKAGRAQVATIQTAVLGLLALLLGFTFSMSAQRFESRRSLILREANDIGTAYLRADLADEPERGALKEALREYVDSRVAFYRAKEEDSPRFERESQQFHARMWRSTVAAAEKRPSPSVALLVASVNSVIDLHTDRVGAIRNHVPPLIFWMLFGVGALGAGITGYASALEGRRHWLPTTIVLVLIAMVMLVIVDLDRPRVGLITAGQSSMIDLQRALLEVGAHEDQPLTTPVEVPR